MSNERKSGQHIRVGLIGAGIQASLTPALHMQEGARQGLSYEYGLLDLDAEPDGADALPRLVQRAKEQGYAGLNITYPCKQRVLALLAHLSEEARILGAVNTVVFGESGSSGHNTDWWGFAESFRRGLPGVSLDHVVLLGAGGAGAAVAYALLRLGVVRLEIHDLERPRATSLAATLRARFPTQECLVVADLESSMQLANGIVHATPTGMAKSPGMPLPAGFLQKRHWVSEIVYFPLETPLLRRARELGCRTLDGGGMAIFQAVGAFELFTGITPDSGRMARHFEELTRRARALDSTSGE